MNRFKINLNHYITLVDIVDFSDTFTYLDINSIESPKFQSPLLIRNSLETTITYITQKRLFNTTLDNSRHADICVTNESGRDDGSADHFRGINDFLDSGNTQSDIHTCHTGKMKCFQCHLSSRFTDTLCAESTNGCA